MTKLLVISGILAINAAGARADFRVYRAMQRAQKAKELAELNARRLQQRRLEATAPSPPDQLPSSSVKPSEATPPAALPPSTAKKHDN